MRLETSRGRATEQSVKESGMHFLGLKLKSEFLKLAIPHLQMLSDASSHYMYVFCIR